MSLMKLHFVRLATFDRTAKDILSDKDEQRMEAEIAKNPEAAPVIRGGSGVRKIRVAIEGHGKIGGARVLYLHVPSARTVYLLLAFAKNVKGNLSDDEIKAVRALAEELKE